MKTPDLERTPKAAVKVAKGRSDKLIRVYGAAAVAKAARREAKRVVPALHADDPMFYCAGIKRKVSTAPRLVKKV
jgi:uncharacterized metal-binding protein